MMRALMIAITLGICLASPAAAQRSGQVEVPRGLWETQPDNNGVVYHVRTRRCGRALCGRVERAKNRSGIDTPSNAVGNKVIWEMEPREDGSFFGEYRGSNARRFVQSSLSVEGRDMRIQACNDQGCRDLLWKRLR